eukprot:scaffold4987_cov135-Skeletonema_menzelii.AAC.7
MTMRYVPEGAVSLSSDAPGWTVENDGDNMPGESRGPICWKCKGECNLRVLKKKAPSNQRICPVCKGNGFLPMKSKYVQSISAEADKSGVITSRRRRPRGWNESGHVPAAVQASLDIDNDDNCVKTTTQQALSILRQANGLDDDFDSKRNDVPANIAKELHEQNCPPWLPLNSGEQLCNLVGRWRILQRVGSHRWTTDDLVTAYVAASTFIASNNNCEAGLRYLDLGCGNASVLQMTTWYLLSSELTNHSCHIEAFGVEAACRARYGPSTDWMASMDPDEYFVPMGEYTSWKQILDKVDNEEGRSVLKFRSTRARPLLHTLVPTYDEGAKECTREMAKNNNQCLTKNESMTYLEVSRMQG